MQCTQPRDLLALGYPVLIAVDAWHWFKEIGLIKTLRNKYGSLRTLRISAALLKWVPRTDVRSASLPESRTVR